MPIEVFQVQLSVKPTTAGEAEPVVPPVLRKLDYHFVIVQDGGEEGIVELEASSAVLSKVAKHTKCKRLTAKQRRKVPKGYAKPKIKKKFRPRPVAAEAEEMEPGSDPFEVDANGNHIVDSIQSVRSGFYLLDVPISDNRADT